MTQMMNRRLLLLLNMRLLSMLSLTRMPLLSHLLSILRPLLGLLLLGPWMRRTLPLLTPLMSLPR